MPPASTPSASQRAPGSNRDRKALRLRHSSTTSATVSAAFTISSMPSISVSSRASSRLTTTATMTASRYSAASVWNASSSHQANRIRRRTAPPITNSSTTENTLGPTGRLTRPNRSSIRRAQRKGRSARLTSDQKPPSTITRPHRAANSSRQLVAGGGSTGAAVSRSARPIVALLTAALRRFARHPG